MAKYLIAVNFTVEADTEDEAQNYLRDMISAALIGEPCPIEDYSVEDTLEVYDTDTIMGDK